MHSPCPAADAPARSHEPDGRQAGDPSWSGRPPARGARVTPRGHRAGRGDPPKTATPSGVAGACSRCPTETLALGPSRPPCGTLTAWCAPALPTPPSPAPRPGVGQTAVPIPRPPVTRTPPSPSRWSASRSWLPPRRPVPGGGWGPYWTQLSTKSATSGCSHRPVASELRSPCRRPSRSSSRTRTGEGTETEHDTGR